MNGSLSSGEMLAQAIRQSTDVLMRTEVAICPPFVYLAALAELLEGSRIGLGGQTLCEHEAGAYTGEVSAAMLRDVGCRYVIVGHSERRQYYAESDALVAEKFVAALRHDLRPILCLGECLDERAAGQTEAVIARQLDAVIVRAGIAAFAKAVIAYEPVWAIGTGQSASPQQAQDVHAFIRGRLHSQQSAVAATIRLLYGGSVKADNAQGLFAMADIDGGLIGGASLQADDFISICRYAEESVE